MPRITTNNNILNFEYIHSLNLNLNCRTELLHSPHLLYLVSFISFSSSNTQLYESRIFCLFTFWVFFPDKSFKLISKYTQKCQYVTCYIKKKKPLCNTLNWGNWNWGFVKLGVQWAERDNCHKNVNIRTLNINGN